MIGGDAVAIKPQSVAHEAAGNGRRFKGWQVARQDANTTAATDADMLRARARALVRDSGWASNAIESYVSNCIGTGIRPQPKHAKKATREKLAMLFEEWAAQSDADGKLDFYGQQAMALRSVMEGGEVLCRLRPRRSEDGLAVPLQLQLMESEMLPLYAPLQNGTNKIELGIEVDAVGRIVAYHLHKNHPDSTAFFGQDAGFSRVPASDILHVFRPLRPGQRRGTTWLAQAIIKLRDVGRYDDAELQRKAFAAFINWFITEADPNDPVLPGTDVDGESQFELQPGSVVRLKSGESVDMSQPADVGQMYSEFMRVQLRAVAAAMGVTYEMLTGDLTGVNYSSIRHGMLEFRRRCEAIQWHMVIHQFCRPVWHRWLDEAALAGVINQSDYLANRAEYRKVEWRVPKWDWVDPLKDVQAELMEIGGGLKSRQQSVAERGYDVEQIDAEQKQDKAREQAAGLTYQTGKNPPPQQDQAAKEVVQ